MTFGDRVRRVTPKYNAAQRDALANSERLWFGAVSLTDIQVEIRRDVPPGKMYMLNDKSMKFSSKAPHLRAISYRRYWWQLWRPKRLWVVMRPSAFSFSYEVELYDKHNPVHKKLMDELGKPGFTSINYKGIPFTPDDEKVKQATTDALDKAKDELVGEMSTKLDQITGLGDVIDREPRRNGTLTPVPKVKTDAEGYGWGQAPGNPKVLKDVEAAPPAGHRTVVPGPGDFSNTSSTPDAGES